MPRIRLFASIGILIIVSIQSAVWSQTGNIPKPFNPPRLVNDYTDLLSANEYRRLESKLVAYSDTTSIQIAIVIIETTEGEDIFTFSQRLAEGWGIGQDNYDNGVLILVTTLDRGLRIHTGYGAEIFLTDAMSKRIISRILAPNFRNSNYFAGLDKATSAIMQLGTGEYQSISSNSSQDFPVELIFILLLIIIIVVISIVKNYDKWDDGDDGGYYRGGRYEDYGRPRRRKRSGWVIMPGSGGSFGGSGGFSGGFGGFGGGSFGGGGASGSW